MGEDIRKTTMGSMETVTEIQKAIRNLRLQDIVDQQENKIMVNKIRTLSHLNFSVSYAFILFFYRGRSYRYTYMVAPCKVQR